VQDAVVNKVQFPLRMVWYGMADRSQTWSRTRTVRESATCRRRVADVPATCRRPRYEPAPDLFMFTFFQSRVRPHPPSLVGNRGRKTMGWLFYPDNIIVNSMVNERTVASCTRIPLDILADRTATQYDRLLASSCRPSVRLSVRLSVCLCRCALWLSELVYRAKSCTSVFLAGMFLFVPSDTFAVRCIV